MSSENRRQRKAGGSARYRNWTFGNTPGIQARIVKDCDPHWAACESLEYEVFTDAESGFYEPNDQGRIDDFDSYGRQEFVAVFSEDRAVGGLRLMYSDEATMREGLFPTYDHRGELQVYPDMEARLKSLDPRKTVDFTSIVVAREARISRTFQAIITRTLRRMWEEKRRYGLACIDTPLNRKYKARGLIFRDLGPSTFYWGSLTTATILDSFSVPQGLDRLLIPRCRAKGYLERAGLVRSP